MVTIADQSRFDFVGVLGRFHRRAKLAADQLELVLAPNRPVRIERARGRVVRCIAGCAWITAPGVAADIFLVCGESWSIPDDGRVLVEAVDTAVVAL